MKRFLSMVLCFTMLFSLGGGVLAAENDGPEMKLTCQESEHTHTEECYETLQTQKLTCGQEESDPVTEPVLDPETGEDEETVVSEGHTHGDECYETTETKKLICGMEEHVHGDGCYEAVENAVEETQPVPMSNGLSVPKGKQNAIKEFHYMDRGAFHALFKELASVEGGIEETSVGIYVYSDDGNTSRETQINKWNGTKYYNQDCLIDGTGKYIQPSEVTKIEMECVYWNSKFPFWHTASVVLPLERLEFKEYPARKCVEVWVRDPSQVAEYTVTFDYNDGNEDTSENVELSVPAGSVLAKDELPTFERDGYTFTGWYQEASAENAYDFGTPITNDTIVYAGWNENGGHTGEAEKLKIQFKICNNTEHGHGDGTFSHTGESTIHANSEGSHVWLKDGKLYTNEECTKPYEYEQTVQNGNNDKKIYDLCGCGFTLSKNGNQIYIYYKEHSGEVEPQYAEYVYGHIFHLGNGQQAFFDKDGNPVTEDGGYTIVSTKAGEHTLNALETMPKGYEDFELEHIAIKYGESDPRNDPSITGKKSYTFDVGSTEGNRPTITFIYTKKAPAGHKESINWYVNLDGQILNVDSLISNDVATPVSGFTKKLVSTDQMITVNEKEWAEQYTAYTNKDGVNNKGGLVGSDAQSAAAINTTIREFMIQYVNRYPDDAAIFAAIKNEITNKGKKIYTVNGDLVSVGLIDKEYYDIHW